MLSHHSQTARRMAVKLGGCVDPRGVMVLSGILQLPGSRVTPRVIKGPRVAPLHPREKFVSQVL